MQVTSPPEAPIALLLNSLPQPNLREEHCPRRARQEIDLMLLAIEALELTASEAILATVQELGLQSLLKNRVNLWQLRSTNPLRRASQRRPLSIGEAKSMVLVIGAQAKRSTVLIRQLLLANQQLSEKGLTPDHHFRLNDYLERFRAHFKSRMNPRRAAVAAYNSSDEQLNQLAITLLSRLLFCTGTNGTQRFWVSLFDGEVV